MNAIDLGKTAACGEVHPPYSVHPYVIVHRGRNAVPPDWFTPLLRRITCFCRILQPMNTW